MKRLKLGLSSRKSLLITPTETEQTLWLFQCLISLLFHAFVVTKNIKITEIQHEIFEKGAYICFFQNIHHWYKNVIYKGQTGH